MKENITFDSTYRNHPINSNKSGCYEKVLEKIENIMNDMLDKHSKIMTVRFDIRYPDNDNTNTSSERISDFAYNLKRNLDRETFEGGHKTDAKVIHVQEQESSSHPHHHFAVIVNANAKQNAYPILEKANTLWKTMMKTNEDGLVDFCNRYENGIIIRRNSPDYEEQYDKTFYQLSYLAKVRGKENRDKGSWLIKTSR